MRKGNGREGAKGKRKLRKGDEEAKAKAKKGKGKGKEQAIGARDMDL